MRLPTSFKALEKFNRMKIDIRRSNDLAELELYEEEINDYISGNKLKITLTSTSKYP